jgi:hypothetical protein
VKDDLQRILADAALREDLVLAPKAAEEEGREPDATLLVYGWDRAIAEWMREQLKVDRHPDLGVTP